MLPTAKNGAAIDRTNEFLKDKIVNCNLPWILSTEPGTKYLPDFFNNLNDKDIGKEE